MAAVWVVLAVCAAILAALAAVWSMGRWLFRNLEEGVPLLLPVRGDAQEVSRQIAGLYWRWPLCAGEAPEIVLLDLGLNEAGRKEIASLEPVWGPLEIVRAERLAQWSRPEEE